MLNQYVRLLIEGATAFAVGASLTLWWNPPDHSSPRTSEATSVVEARHLPETNPDHVVAEPPSTNPDATQEESQQPAMKPPSYPTKHREVPRPTTHRGMDDFFAGLADAGQEQLVSSEVLDAIEDCELPFIVVGSDCVEGDCFAVLRADDGASYTPNDRDNVCAGVEVTHAPESLCPGIQLEAVFVARVDGATIPEAITNPQLMQALCR